MPKLAAFPKAYLDNLCVDRTMSISEWIDMSSTLRVDGLEFYRRIAAEAGMFLRPSGQLLLEFGDGQAEVLRKLFSDEKWIVDEIVADYSARPRILIARRQET